MAERESNKKLDVLTLLGHNITGFPTDKIRKTPDHLSVLSKLNARAGGILVRKGITSRLLISTGQTSGTDMPSEAYAMYEYIQKNFPDLRNVEYILETSSLDTGYNAIATHRIVKKRGYQREGLSSVGIHLKNALTTFRAHGHSIKAEDCYPSEQVYANHLAESQSNQVASEFLDAYEQYIFNNGDHALETVRAIVNLIDPKNTLLHQITKRTRG